MSSPIQSKYIADLVVIKTKEFKEVKEMLMASDITGTPGFSPELIANSESIAEITHSLTDLQASKFIDLLIATKEPVRSRVYARKRVERTIVTLDDIKSTIDRWDFDGLQ